MPTEINNKKINNKIKALEAKSLQRTQTKGYLELRVKELEALNRFAFDVTSPLSLSKVIELAYEYILTTVAPDLVVIYLTENDHLISQGEKPDNPKWQNDSPEKKYVGQCLCGLAARDKKPIYSLDIHSDGRCTFNECKAAGIHSFASFPLLVGEESLGVLGVGSFRERDFAQQSNFLEIFASQLALAVNSSGLYKILKLYSDELKQSLEEQEKREEALRESEEKYRNLFETMAQGVVYQDLEGHITSANPAAERILGLSLEQMQGRTSLDPRWRAIYEDGTAFPGETHPSMVTLQTGKEVKNVVMGVFNPHDDEYRWINVHAVPQFKPGEDTPYQVYTTFEDITDRKRAEWTLAYEAEFLRVISGIANEFINLPPTGVH